MKKPPLLFLCHRIPFPPNKGDKIRSFNMLKVLCEHFTVYLGSFVDDPYDWQFSHKLEDMCAEVFLIDQNKRVCTIKGALGFLTGRSISEHYYSSPDMQNWTDQTLQQYDIENVFIYSSVMAQFTVKHHAKIRQVVDFVDVDSDKWRQYAERKSGVMKWVYNREHQKLRVFEDATTSASQHALFVSDPEADLYKQALPHELHQKVSGLLNGVDITFFDPDTEFDDTFNESINVVFTGAMDYWANIDAVIWFHEFVWPLVRKTHPSATFFVVGGNPSSKVQSLNGTNGIVVTGRVRDVRPYIRNADVVVAPLQIARGIQNKVLEGLSMAKPVVATTMAMEGIAVTSNGIKVADSAEVFADFVNELINHEHSVPENRQWVVDNLEWSSTIKRLPALFEAKI